MVQAAVPAATFALRDPRVPARISQSLIGLSGIAIIVQSTVTMSTDHPSTALADGSTVAMAVTFVLSIVAFLIWLSGCRRNAGILAPGAVPGGPGRAVWVWFIPFAGLWWPRAVVRDIWRAGAGDAADTRLINGWWAAWLGHIAVSLGAVIYTKASGDAPGVPYTVLVAAVDLAVTVLALLVVRRVTSSQTAPSA